MSTIMSGHGVPNASFFASADGSPLYIDMNTGKMYAMHDTTNEVMDMTVSGSTGPQGPIGNTGSQGTQGNPGAPGSQGNPGVDGDDGAPGAPGQQGIQGIPGNTGTQGPQGDPGTDGIQGIQGIQGPEGPPGAGGSSSYSPGSFTIATENYQVMARRLILTTTQRATIEGTGALVIHG